jgi:tRNA(Ile)-lysidine synthase
VKLDPRKQLEARVRAKKLFRDGAKILVAVSGGLDSMVLLALLHSLAGVRRWKLTVAHFNHQLRGRAGDADERLVRDAASSRRLPVVVGRGDVRGLARRRGVSVEMAARELRHKFLARAAARRGIRVVALAHHADDQVELFFLRLLRGTGGQGLAGMKWVGPSPYDPKISLVRPLLDRPKSDLQTFARQHAIPFAEDASNARADIQRNRVRLELLPLLRRRYQPALARAVLRCMEVARAESDFTAQAAGRWLARRRKGAFARLPVAVPRRLVQLQLFHLKQPLDFDLIEHLRARPGQPVSAGPGHCLVRADDGRVCLREVEKTAFQTGTLRLKLGRRGAADFGRVKITWEIADETGMKLARRPNLEQFDADKVGAKVCLRHWRPGDRFWPIGADAAVKLQDLFTNLKVPRAERHRRVVAATGRGRLFWVEGLRVAEDFKLEPATLRRLKWAWRRAGAPDKSQLRP